MHYAIIYLGLCLLVGLFGINRKLGFWGYFFGSVLLTPILGLVMVLVSDARRTRSPKVIPRLSEPERGAIDYAHQRAIVVYQDRIDELVRTGRISREYADAQLAGMVRKLRKTLQFDDAGRPSSPLDPILQALEHVPPRAAESEVPPAESGDSPSGHGRDAEQPVPVDDVESVTTNGGEPREKHPGPATAATGADADTREDAAALSLAGSGGLPANDDERIPAQDDAKRGRSDVS